MAEDRQIEYTSSEQAVLDRAEAEYIRWCRLTWLEASCRQKGVPMPGPSAIARELGVSRSVAIDMLGALGRPLPPSRRRKKSAAAFVRAENKCLETAESYI